MRDCVKWQGSNYGLRRAMRDKDAACAVQSHSSGGGETKHCRVTLPQ